MREFNGTSKTKISSSSTRTQLGSICAAAALDTIITFNSDRMRIYVFYVPLCVSIMGKNVLMFALIRKYYDFSFFATCSFPMSASVFV